MNEQRPAPRRMWKARVWNVFAACTVGLLLWSVSSSGARRAFAILATPLHELPVPGLTLLADYQGLDRLDLASIFALVILVTTSTGLVYAFRAILYDRVNIGVTNVVTAKWIHVVVGLCLLCLDAILFAFGLSHDLARGWGASQPNNITPGCIFGGSAYALALVIICLVSVHLEDH